MAVPTLKTERLLLRPFSMDDVPAVVDLAGQRQIAATTLLIPHPYSPSDAEKWIERHDAEFASGRNANFAITLRGSLIGAISMVTSPEHQRAELGYWIGVPFWGQGYATEAGREVVRYGFTDRDLLRLTAHHFANNPASGRVLERMGMKKEGLFPRHIQKWGTFVDCIMYGMLREDFSPAR